ncbi:MAG TPA: VWA domain-containing protein [Candidatus Limiplasma sp.]|nr:VWA domain-containing protein [Candidatus Limiplasma sp.]HPR79055.1 VWA domain-containing protein [Candidatus Limiplasma sp.]
MKQDITDLVFILDCSGSMYGLVRDTVGGFNSMLAKQKALEGDARVTTVLFNNECTVLHDRVPIQEVLNLTEKEYVVGRSTALLDAIGLTIDRVDLANRKARADERAAKTVFVITTDGLENASREYTVTQVQSIVSQQQEQLGWEFIFLGANMDAITVAKAMGISASRAACYRNDAQGTQTNFSAVGDALASVRSGAPIPDEWKAAIDADYQTRGQKRRG